MKPEWNGRQQSAEDLRSVGLARSLSDWADLGPAAVALQRRTLRLRSPYNIRLTSLQAARRFLTVRIEDEQPMGRPTEELERKLEAKRTETRSFLAYLETHANVQPQAQAGQSTQRAASKAPGRWPIRTGARLSNSGPLNNRPRQSESQRILQSTFVFDA